MPGGPARTPRCQRRADLKEEGGAGAWVSRNCGSQGQDKSCMTEGAGVERREISQMTRRRNSGACWRAEAVVGGDLEGKAPNRLRQAHKNRDNGGGEAAGPRLKSVGWWKRE